MIGRACVTPRGDDPRYAEDSVSTPAYVARGICRLFRGATFAFGSGDAAPISTPARRSRRGTNTHFETMDGVISIRQVVPQGRCQIAKHGHRGRNSGTRGKTSAGPTGIVLRIRIQSPPDGATHNTLRSPAAMEHQERIVISPPKRHHARKSGQLFPGCPEYSSTTGWPRSRSTVNR